VSALAPLAKIVDQAQRAPAYHWLDTQIVGLIRYAVEALRQGLWDFAFDNAEKALKKEEARNNGRVFALRFSEELIQLRDRVTHDDRGVAQVVSLKAEIAEKKDGGAPASYLAYAVSRGPVPSVAMYQFGKQKERKDERVQATERAAIPPATPAPADCIQEDQRQVDRATAAQLRIAYWDAILSRAPSQIRAAVRAARRAGLGDVRAETEYQLTKDLEPALRAPREIAMRIWKERE